MEISHENANFCGSETDFLWRKKTVRGEKKLVVQKKRREEMETLVSVLHQIPVKHTEHVHTRLLPVVVS